jgi:hypothetical protein
MAGEAVRVVNVCDGLAHEFPEAFTPLAVK